MALMNKFVPIGLSIGFFFGRCRVEASHIQRQRPEDKKWPDFPPSTKACSYLKQLRHDRYSVKGLTWTFAPFLSWIVK